MTKKAAIQSNRDLKRSGMPNADSQYKLLKDGILSGDLTRLEELTKLLEDLEAPIDVNSREGRQALGDFSLAFRECGRAARAAAKEEELTDNKGQLKISLWPWLVPARQLLVPYDEKLCSQVIGELKQDGMLRDVKVRNAPQVALDLVKKQPRDSYDRETSLRATRVIARQMNEACLFDCEGANFAGHGADKFPIFSQIGRGSTGQIMNHLVGQYNLIQFENVTHFSGAIVFFPS